MRERLNKLYKKDVYDQVGVHNLGWSTLAESLSNVEHIFHTNISQKL